MQQLKKLMKESLTKSGVLGGIDYVCVGLTVSLSMMSKGASVKSQNLFKKSIVSTEESRGLLL